MIDIGELESELNELFKRNINSAKKIIEKIFENVLQNDVSETNWKYKNIYRNYIHQKIDKNDSLKMLWTEIEGYEKREKRSEILGRIIVDLIRKEYDHYHIDLLAEYIENTEEVVANKILSQIETIILMK